MKTTSARPFKASASDRRRPATAPPRASDLILAITSVLVLAACCLWLVASSV